MSAPTMTTEDAQALAKRWGPPPAWLDPAERDQLFAWVQARCLAEGDLGWHGDPRIYLTETIGLALDMDSEDISHAEYLDRAWDLIDAAKGWPS